MTSIQTNGHAAAHAAPAIKIVPPEAPLRDVMNGAGRMEIPCLDHGFVALVDCMPRLVPEGKTADFAIVQSARVSYGEGTKQVSEDRGLVRYLMRHRHSTPFEMVEFKFHCAMPIFVARQWIRHRTANVNEQSGRYGEMPELVYVPEAERIAWQNPVNKQGSGAQVPAGLAERVQNVLRGDADATDVVVKSQVTQRANTQPIALDYRLEKTSQGWKIYDLNVENIWLIENYRNQFAQQISQNGIDGLIQALNQRAQQ